MAPAQSAVKAQENPSTQQPALPPPTHAGAPRSASPLGFTNRDLERRRKFVDLTHEDIARILTAKTIVTENADRFTEQFFEYLKHFEEAAPLFKNTKMLAELKKIKRDHLIAMVMGDYGIAYAEQRAQLGALYAKAGLEIRVFLGAFYQLMLMIGVEIMKHSSKNPQAGFEVVMSIRKLATFDLSIIVDVLIEERERVISAQQDALRELSTPVIQIRDRLLILPIIGLIDSARAMQLTESLLHAIRENRARVVVMDITGVAAVDSRVANHLIQTVAAAKLMGATVIVTGLSAEVAQALVALGVDLGRINTIGDLQGGMEEAERLLGYRVAPLEAAAAKDA